MNDITKFKPARAFQRLDPNQSLGEGIAVGFSSIRYRGKTWSLQHGGKSYGFRREDDGSPLTYIDVIVVGISQGLSKVYFGNQGDWNEDSASGPICASLKGDVPDPGVPIPQSKTCALCKHNEWLPDRKGKECKDHKRMAILLMPSMTAKMLGAPLTEPVHLKIPPGSLKSLKNYGDSLTHQGLPFASVITRIAFAQDKLFEMKFEVVQALTDEEAPLVFDMMESRVTRQILGGIPEIREVQPMIEAQEERIETGIMAAFGKPADVQEVKRRGRPPGSANKPKLVTAQNPPSDLPGQRVVDEEPSDTPQVEDTATELPWEESDPEVDERLNKVLGKRMQDMLK